MVGFATQLSTLHIRVSKSETYIQVLTSCSTLLSITEQVLHLLVPAQFARGAGHFPSSAQTHR
jgi:hypothetical protein